MEHEDAKQGKLKTRELAVFSESLYKEWQEQDPGMIKIKERIGKEDTNKFRLENEIVVTKEGKTWIPENKKHEFILAMHKMLCHAGVRKVVNYIEKAYDMEKLHLMVEEVIKCCEK